MKRIENRTAVITGAAGGIGLALAECLLARGAHVAAVDVVADKLEASVASLRERFPDQRVSSHVVDVSDRAAMMALPEAVLAVHPAIEIVINNAGVTIEATFEESTWDDMAWVVGVNMWGVVHGCKAFLPHLREADEAHLVNLSSLFGLIGVPTQSIYCMTKYAVRGLTETLWEELAPTRVGVTLVHPGGVATDIMKNARYHDESRSKATLTAFFEQMAIPASEAAERIVAAIEAGEQRLVLPDDAAKVDHVKRKDPVGANRMIAQGLVAAMGLGVSLEQPPE